MSLISARKGESHRIDYKSPGMDTWRYYRLRFPGYNRINRNHRSINASSLTSPLVKLISIDFISDLYEKFARKHNLAFTDS